MVLIQGGSDLKRTIQSLNTDASGLVSPDLKRKSATQRDILQARSEYKRGLDHYRLRIKAIGFTGYDRVLDAACGYGQWTIVLSEHNTWVSGLDMNPGGLEIARRAFHLAGRKNIALHRGDLHALPYRDASFDAVFCYGALMFTREDVAVSEIVRVLKPGGRLYISSDGPAWPLYRIMHFGWKQKGFRSICSSLSIALRTFFHVLCRRFSHQRTFLRKRDVVRLFNRNRIRLQYYGADGSFGNEKQNFRAPFGKTLLGLPVDFEVIGNKEHESGD
jgi:SAM-dependent methyltransferase